MWLLAWCFKCVFSCVVLLCCAVFQFLSAVLCVSLLFVLGYLLIQLEVRAFGGGLLTLRRFSALLLSLHRRSSVLWLLMPCVLLVRHVGAKSRDPPLESTHPLQFVPCCLASPQLAVGPTSSLT